MDTLDLARELIRRPSVSPADAGCQALIASLLERRASRPSRLKFGAVDNLWARRGRSAPALVFAGHTDVVPPGPREQWKVDPFAATVRAASSSAAARPT
jgi:succinyl-diaminopimelate desuccinylase